MWIFEEIDKGVHFYGMSPWAEFYLFPAIKIRHNFSSCDEEFEPRLNFYLLWWSCFVKVSFIRVDSL